MPTVINKSKFQFLPFLISLFITLAIGIVASLFTTPQIHGWYSTLHKASFNPPAWLFAPVWTIVYILIATAAYKVWQLRDASRLYQVTLAVYVMQLLLNFSWSIVFFGGHQVFAALLVIIVLWGVIIFNIVYFGKFQ